MNMPPKLRKLSLTVHIAVSVGWFGAMFTYVILGISAVTSHDPQAIRAAWTSMALIAGSVILPLNLLANVTGVMMALGTQWGLLRHRWVLVTLVLSILVTIFWMQHMPTVSSLAQTAQVSSNANLAGGFGGDLLYSGVTLGALLLITGITVFKPRGTINFRLRSATSIPSPIQQGGQIRQAKEE